MGGAREPADGERRRSPSPFAVATAKPGDAEFLAFGGGRLMPAVKAALARAVASGAPLSNRAVAQMVLARGVDAADLVSIAARAKRNAGVSWNGAAHKLAWELIHVYCPGKGGALAGSRYEPGHAGIGLAGTTVVIGDDAIRRVAAGEADAVGKELQALLGGAPPAVGAQAGAGPSPSPLVGASAGVEVSTPAAPEEPVAVPASPMRAEFLELAKAAVGAVEGTTAFDTIVEPAGLKDAREKAAAKGKLHTTCIDVQTVLYSRARGKLTPAQRAAVPYAVTPFNAATLKGWVEARPGMTRRPNPGDIYVLSKIKQQGKDDPTPEKGDFSHVGIIERITPDTPTDGVATETWVTIDGGQPAPTGSGEMIARSIRTYAPETGLITGEKMQDNRRRLLTGWVDLDRLTAP